MRKMWPKSCQKQPVESPKCANCSRSHPANYRSCESQKRYQQPQKQKVVKNNPNINNRRQQQWGSGERTFSNTVNRWSNQTAVAKQTSQSYGRAAEPAVSKGTCITRQIKKV